MLLRISILVTNVIYSQLPRLRCRNNRQLFNCAEFIRNDRSVHLSAHKISPKTRALTFTSMCVRLFSNSTPKRKFRISTRLLPLLQEQLCGSILSQFPRHDPLDQSDKQYHCVIRISNNYYVDMRLAKHIANRTRMHITIIRFLLRQ